MTIDAVFFDLDGTLLDTAPDLAAALNALLVRNGLRQLDYEPIRQVTSNGANALLQLGFGCSPGDKGHAALRDALLAYYLDNICEETRTFPGIDALLEQLASSGIAWGIVTNKPWVYTESLLRHFSFPTPPVSVICPDHVTHKKPAPEALWLACKEAAVEPNKSLYVGDHKRDIDCGINAGSHTIAVGYGYFSEPNEYLGWKADHCVAHANEIWPYIEKKRVHRNTTQ